MGVEGDDLESFEVYVAARGPVLLRLAVMLTGRRDDADDLVQSSLLRAHKHWDRISSMEAADAYMRRIVVNEHISLLRRKRRLIGATARDRPSSFATPDAAEVTVERAAMWQALASLPPKQRAVLVLRYYEDLTDDQIAEVLHCGAGTVRSNASRALQALRVITATPRKEDQHESARR